MQGKLRRILPHLAILICNMYVVFFLIDRVNTAMNFIDNGLTKGLILILSVAGISNALYIERAEAARRRRTARQTETRARYDDTRDDRRYPYSRGYASEPDYSRAREWDDGVNRRASAGRYSDAGRETSAGRGTSVGRGISPGRYADSARAAAAGRRPDAGRGTAARRDAAGTRRY